MRSLLDWTPVVHQVIKVRLVGKDLTWTADEQTTWKTFDQNAVFLTKGAIAVVYSNYDPLTTSATPQARLPTTHPLPHTASF
jgi:hypothetical protein